MVDNDEDHRSHSEEDREAVQVIVGDHGGVGWPGACKLEMLSVRAIRFREVMQKYLAKALAAEDECYLNATVDVDELNSWSFGRWLH